MAGDSAESDKRDGAGADKAQETGQGDGKAVAQARREARLAAALRENLRRRKAQARGRKAGPEETGG